MKGYFLDKEGCHYRYKIVKSKVTLFYANIGQWVSELKGKLAAKLVDNGNSFQITFQNNGGKKRIYLDICEIHELYNLIRLYKKTHPRSFSKYKQLSPHGWVFKEDQNND